jgi:hypothetical protein
VAGFFIGGRMGGMKLVFVFAGILSCVLLVSANAMTIVPGPGAETERATYEIVFAILAVLSFWLAKRGFRQPSPDQKTIPHQRTNQTSE